MVSCGVFTVGPEHHVFWVVVGAFNTKGGFCAVGSLQ